MFKIFKLGLVAILIISSLFANEITKDECIKQGGTESWDFKYDIHVCKLNGKNIPFERTKEQIEKEEKINAEQIKEETRISGLKQKAVKTKNSEIYNKLSSNSQCIKIYLSNSTSLVECAKKEDLRDLIIAYGNERDWNKMSENDLCKLYNSRFSGSCINDKGYVYTDNIGNANIQELDLFLAYKKEIIKKQKEDLKATPYLITDNDIKIIDATKDKISKEEMIKLLKKVTYSNLWIELSNENNQQLILLNYATDKLAINTIKIPLESIKSIQKDGTILFNKNVVMTTKRTELAIKYNVQPRKTVDEFSSFDFEVETTFNKNYLFQLLGDTYHILNNNKYRGTITREEILYDANKKTYYVKLVKQYQPICKTFNSVILADAPFNHFLNTHNLSEYLQLLTQNTGYDCITATNMDKEYEIINCKYTNAVGDVCEINMNGVKQFIMKDYANVYEK